jgi:NTP pyrophosphatase (non-canonical NTP hydrolase)
MENSMTFNEYQDGVVKTWDCGKLDQERLLNAVLGIAGESGEYADLIKKQEFHGIPADPRSVLKELGDILYYVTAAAIEHGYTLEQVAITNNQKLAARYPQGFKLGGGIREEDHGPQSERTRIHSTSGVTKL